MLPVIFDLLKQEGLCLGGSTGINVMGAIKLAEKLGPGHTIVTILCDGGTRYQSKLFNPAFLKEKGLPVPARSEEHTSELQSLMRISYAVFCLKKKKQKN